MSLLHVRTHHLRRRSIGAPEDGAPIDVTGALARTPLPDPDGLWFIDRVEVHTSGRADLGARPVAELLGRQIAAAVCGTLERGPTQDGVRWFPDRATYLATWLLDLSHGGARNRWEYSQFGDQDFSPALCDRAGAEPHTVLAALLSVPGAELDRLIGLLRPVDAAAVVHALAIGDRPVDRLGLARTAARLRQHGRLPRDFRQATVAVLLHADLGGQLPGPGDATAARDLVLLAAALRDCDPAAREGLIAAACAGDARALAAYGHGDLAAAFAGWPADEREAAVTAVVVDGGDVARPERTGLGGLFLVLPLLAELPLADACSGWLDPPGADAATLAGALAMGAVLGVGVDLLADPWLQLALGLPSDASRHVVEWSRQVTDAHADRFTRAFASLVGHRALAATGDLTGPSLLLDPPLAPALARAIRVAAGVLLRELSHRLPGQARAGVDHLRRNVLTFGATVRAGDDAIGVELDPAPFGVLLSLTGMNRRRFTLPATGERPWVLTQRP